MKLSYAIAQWKQGHDQFVVHEDHEKVFKTLSVAGFHHIEVAAGSGRWDPLGNRIWIEKSYGSVAALRKAMRDCGILSVTSYTFNPELPIAEEGSHGRNALNEADHPGIAGTVGRLASLVSELGGQSLVVRPLPSAWKVGAVDRDAISTAARGWSVAAASAAEHGVTVNLNIDCLGALRTAEQIEMLLDACDDRVLLSIDTADATIMGLDPVDLYQRFSGRIGHIQLKDARDVDTLNEATAQYAERTFMNEGGSREIARWYYELMIPGGLIDFPRFVEAIADFDGLLVVESDQTPHPTTSALMNGWAVNRLFAGRLRGEAA